MTQKPHLSLSNQAGVRLRGQLLARVQAVQLLNLAEPDVAKLIKEIEGDPLFNQMLYPSQREWKVLKFQPHPRTRLSPSFYEVDDRTAAGGESTDVSALLEERKGVLALIQKIGQENFEKHFLRAGEALAPEALAETLGIAPADVKRLQDFLLAFSVQAEFFDPSSLPNSTRPQTPGRRVTRLARLGMGENGEVTFDLMSPHLARGRYDIHYERFQSLADQGSLTPEKRRHMKAFIRRLELINWRQNTLFRIVDLICHAQRKYLGDKDTLKRAPFTQRQMAKKLAVAPSTVNRAIQDRSLVLPWGEEVLLEDLFPNRKTLCVEALETLEVQDKDFGKRSDRELQDVLKAAFGHAVPRRTLNTYRRLAADIDTPK